MGKNKMKSIKKLVSLTLIGGGMLATLPLVVSSCSNNSQPQSIYSLVATKTTLNQDNLSTTITALKDGIEFEPLNFSIKNLHTQGDIPTGVLTFSHINSKATLLLTQYAVISASD
jgi:hypothetical protein